MELTFEKHDLLYALRVLQGATGGRDTLPILSNVLIRAEDSRIECIATDLEVGIKMQVAGEVKEGGAVTVPAKKLVDIVKALPVGKPIEVVTTANARVEITCGDGVYKIIGLPDEEFPQLPSVEGEALTIGGETLMDVIQKTEFAASTEEVRYFLNGLYFNLLTDRTEVVATDGRCLALTHCEPLNASEETSGFIVPLRAVRAIAKTFADAGEVEVSISENLILLTDGDATLTARLVEGDYPNYEKMIPESADGRTVVLKDQILGATRRVALLSNPKTHLICLEIDTEQIQVSARAPELGEAHETVPVASGNGSVRIGLDARLLVQALAHIQSESLAIEFIGGSTPVLIKPVSDDEYISLIMPMRLEGPSE